MKAPKQFNNITERLADDLKTSLTSKSRLSIVVASFSIYIYEALKEELENIDLMPLDMGAVRHANDNVQHSTIFILKNKNNGTSIDKTNLQHPFNIAYISHNGEILCDHLSPKKLLDNMRHICKGKTTPDMPLCRQVSKETRDGKKMDHYSNLPQRAIDSIIHVKEEKNIDSLFSAGETTALTNNIRGLDDFELIIFLIIK